MGRRRLPGNAKYPEGIYFSRGWFFWRDRATGTWHKLGKEWDKAAKEQWLKLSTGAPAAGTVAHMLTSHMKHRLQLHREGTLSKRTYEDNEEYVVQLNKFFGAMPYHAVNSRHVSAYLQNRTWQPPDRKGPDGKVYRPPVQRAPVRANKEVSLLSSAYAWALTSPEYPLVTINPCTGVDRNPTKRNERCPEIWEIEAAKQHATPLWRLIFDFAYVCGQRGIDTRLLRKSAVQEDGIHVKQTKTGAEIVINWTPELRTIVANLLAHTASVEHRRNVVCPYVIASRTGGPYTAGGWKANMYKFVRAAMADKDNPLEVPFSFHTFRARSATDEEELDGTNPQHRLGHTRRATTDIYMRGKRTKRVKPLALRKAS